MTLQSFGEGNDSFDLRFELHLTNRSITATLANKRTIDMSKQSAVSIPALILCFGMFTAASVSAQPTSGMAGHPGMSTHHQMMGDIMKDMSQEMSKMTEQMSGAERTPEQRKQMGQRMESMSKMMHRMSGLEARPAMKEPEMQKQMEQMRKQMDEMKGDPSMKSPAK